MILGAIGDDHHKLDTMCATIIGRYRARYPHGLNLTTLDTRESGWEDLFTQTLKYQTFFDDVRLIVIKYPGRAGDSIAKQLQDYPDTQKSEIVVLLWESTGSASYLKSQPVLAKLLVAKGNKLYRCDRNPSDRTEPKGKPGALDPFAPLDAFMEGNPKKTFCLFWQALEYGEDPIALISRLASQVRSAMAIQDLRERQIRPNDIITRSGVHPFVVRKLERQIRNQSMVTLTRTFEALHDLETTIKRGMTDGESSLLLLALKNPLVAKYR